VRVFNCRFGIRKITKGECDHFVCSVCTIFISSTKRRDVGQKLCVAGVALARAGSRVATRGSAVEDAIFGSSLCRFRVQRGSESDVIIAVLEGALKKMDAHCQCPCERIRSARSKTARQIREKSRSQRQNVTIFVCWPFAHLMVEMGAKSIKLISETALYGHLCQTIRMFYLVSGRRRLRDWETATYRQADTK
jgi:hypothetical protein